MANDKRGCFFQVPNFIDDAGLGSSAFRLYCHLLRACNNFTEPCRQGTRYLADCCNMATGTITSAKKELKAKGLITIKKIRTQNGLLDEITLVNVWELNQKVYDGTVQDLSEKDAITLTAKNAQIHFQNLRNQKPKLKLPDSFAINKEMRDWALKNAPSIDIWEETEHFSETHQSKKTKTFNWIAAWKKWMLNKEKANLLRLNNLSNFDTT